MRRKKVMQNAVLSDSVFETLLNMLKDEVKSWNLPKDIILAKSPILPIVARRNSSDIKDLSFWETFHFSAARRKQMLHVIIENINPSLVKDVSFWYIIHDIGDTERKNSKNLIRYFIVDLYKRFPKLMMDAEVLKGMIETGLFYSIPDDTLEKAFSYMEFEKYEDLKNFFLILASDNVLLNLKYRGIGNIYLLKEIFSNNRQPFKNELGGYYNAIPKESLLINEDEYYRNAFNNLKEVKQ